MSLHADLDIENVLNFYDADYSQLVLTELLTYKYQDLKLRFHDKEFIPRRKVLAFGDSGLTYTFSGTNVPANKWSTTLLDIKKDVEARTGEEYNYVLLNYYANGLSKIGSHKDDETSLDPKSTIPTLSFGATRTMQFTRKDFPSKQVQLLNGSLLLMKPPTNKFWNHEIPAEPDVSSPRVSLTFKKIIKTSRKRTFDDCFSTPSKCSPKPTTSRRVSCEPIPENDWMTQLYMDFNPPDQPAHSKSSITIKEWNLGYGLIVSLQQLDSKLYVHMREHEVHGDVYDSKFYPTKRGIVMTMHTFQDFQKKIYNVNCKYVTSSVVCNNQLLILSNKGELIFKQLYLLNEIKLKEHSLKVDFNYLIAIREIVPELSETIKSTLITTVLPAKILEVSEAKDAPHLNLFHELTCALQDEFQTNAYKLFHCDGCEIDDFSQFNHDCMCKPSEDICRFVGEDPLIIFNVKRIIEGLRAKNILQYFNAAFFDTLIYADIKDKLIP